MIRYLRGNVLEKFRNQLILDVNGVGYDIYVTATTLTSAMMSQEAQFYISESIREDAHDLYGFMASSERDTFELLRKVSGVGPKVALAIVGFFSPSEFASILEENDASRLSLVPGVGKKLASKIVVELKDKSATLALPYTDNSDDTVAALQSLGYSRAEITVAVAKVPKDIANSNDKITWILRHLGG